MEYEIIFALKYTLRYFTFKLDLNVDVTCKLNRRNNIYKN